MRTVVIFLCIFFSNNTFASNLNITIDHHGIIDSLKSDNSMSIPYKTLPSLKQKDFIFQTERLKKHYEKVIRLIPNNSFLILLGNENNIITGVDKNFVPTPISLSHTGIEEHNHPRHMHAEVMNINLDIKPHQNYLHILKKSNNAIEIKQTIYIN
jgi:hypothetical protein